MMILMKYQVLSMLKVKNIKIMSKEVNLRYKTVTFDFVIFSVILEKNTEQLSKH